MKYEIKFKETKKRKFPKENFTYVRLFEKENFAEIFDELNFSVKKSQIKKIEKSDKKEIRFNPSENFGSLYILKKIEREKIDDDFFRDFLASVIIDADETLENLIIEFPFEADFITEIFGDFENYFQSITEGILLGNYTFDKYKSEKKSAAKLDVTFINGGKQNLKKIIARTEKIIGAVYYARDFVNEPANTLTTQEFAKRVKKLFKGTAVKVQILNEEQLRKKKMTAILSVGQASVNPPLLIKLSYKGRKPKEKIALVGKGVMYDAGGLSIKPTSGMLDMKGDMAGAATVVGILKAVSDLELPYEIYGVIPVVENVISGNAYKPGDIIKTSSGKTIEIGNTDAEGRLILADALEFAEKLNPNKILDFATLTGACLVALGQSYAGVFTKDDALAESVSRAAKITSEYVWRLPLPEKYLELLKSDLADISNVGSTRWGGSITAALFLKFFLSEEIQKNWAHFDIAGPAFKHSQASYTKKYATGYGVRLITNWLMNLA